MSGPAPISRPSDLQNAGHHLARDSLGPAFLAWAARRWPERRGLAIGDWAPPANGGSSQIILFELDWTDHGRPRTEKLVLHLEVADEPVFPRLSDRYGSSAEMEYRVQHAIAANSRAAVPPMVALECDPQYLGQPFYLAGQVEGFVPPTFALMSSPLMTAQLSPVERTRLVMGGIDQLAAIHAIDWRRAGLEFLLPEPAIGSVTQDHMRRVADHVAFHLYGQRHPELEAGMAWLVANVPTDRALALTWGDCRMGNMIYNSACNPAAVLDWEGAAILPRDADLGWWLLYDWRNHEGEGLARLPGVPTRPEQLDRYVELTGHRPANLTYWAVAASVKTVMAMQAIAHRMEVAGLVAPGQCTFMHNNHHTRFIQLVLDGADPLALP